ncbi:hypothetical protein GCM10009759_49350 [Kitasatospora saccharophila]|uniref:Uncharacterized protein n=1 Tax=Kitasatospora saccharophila TaxID=407973 RepID=A0ABP5J0T3_9ACTN
MADAVLPVLPGAGASSFDPLTSENTRPRPSGHPSGPRAALPITASLAGARSAPPGYGSWRRPEVADAVLPVLPEGEASSFDPLTTENTRPRPSGHPSGPRAALPITASLAGARSAPTGYGGREWRMSSCRGAGRPRSTR